MVLRNYKIPCNIISGCRGRSFPKLLPFYHINPFLSHLLFIYKNCIMKNLFFLAVAALLTGHTVLQAQPSVQNIIKNAESPDSKTSKLKAIINTYVNKGVPGMIVLVKTGDVTWQTAAGFSDVEKGIAMETTNELMIASITKMFVAVVTLRLQEEGKLDIDKPVSTFNCGYRFKNIPNAEKITIRHLL